MNTNSRTYQNLQFKFSNREYWHKLSRHYILPSGLVTPCLVYWALLGSTGFARFVLPPLFIRCSACDKHNLDLYRLMFLPRDSKE